MEDTKPTAVLQPTRGRKRQLISEEENDEYEVPPKKRRVYEEWLHSSEERVYTDTKQNQSPNDSAYFSLSLPSCVSQPSVGNTSGFGNETSPSVADPLAASFIQPASQEYETNFQCHSDLVNLLRRKYKTLKKEIDTRFNLADKLFERGVLQKNAMENLTEERNRRRRVDILIKALAHDSRAKIPKVYEKVLRVFTKEKIDYLLKDTDTNTSAKVKASKAGSNPASNSEETYQLLIMGLRDDLEPRDIIDSLLVSGVLSFVDHEDIYTATARADRIKILLTHIERVGSHCFCQVTEVLRKKYPKQTKRILDPPLLQDQKITPQLDRKDTDKDGHQSWSTNSPYYTSNIELKLKFGPTSVPDVEMSIVDHNNCNGNLRLEEESMDTADLSIDGFEFSSVKIKFAACSEQAIYKLKKALKDPRRLKQFMTRMITQEQMRSLQERRVQNVKVEISIPESGVINRKCTCKLSKELIVKSYTYLEKNMADPTSIIEALVKSNLLEETVKSEFIHLKESKLHTSKRKEFILMKLLTLPAECICFFEKELRSMNQDNIIQKLIEKEDTEKGAICTTHIGPQDIRRNMNYLVEEIEPKMFVSVFEDTNTKVEDMISSETRRKRTKLFLESMLKAGKKSVEKFERELRRQGMTYIIDIICCKDTDYENLRNNILKFYGEILNEIEPLRLKDKLVKEHVFKAKEFEDMLKTLHWRRDRVVWLVRELLRRDKRAVAVFRDSLVMANYDGIAKSISDSEDEVVDCPFLVSKIQEKIGMKASPKDFTFSAEFNIKWVEEINSKPVFPLCQHENTKDEVDKTEFTKSWIDSLSDVTETSGMSSLPEISETYCNPKNEESQLKTAKDKKGTTEPQGLFIPEQPSNLMFESRRMKPPYTEGMNSTEESNVPHCCGISTATSFSDDFRQVTNSDSSTVSSLTDKRFPLDNNRVPSPCRNVDQCSVLMTASGIPINEHLLAPFLSRSPVGSAGTSCNSNGYEEISPCSSPGLSMEGEGDLFLKHNFNTQSVLEHSDEPLTASDIHDFSRWAENLPQKLHTSQANSLEIAGTSEGQKPKWWKSTVATNKYYRNWLLLVFTKVKNQSGSQSCYQNGDYKSKNKRKFNTLAKQKKQ